MRDRQLGRSTPPAAPISVLAPAQDRCRPLVRRGRLADRTVVLTSRATGMPILDAQADFRRARRHHAVALLARRLLHSREERHPLSSAVAPAARAGSPGRLEMVPLRQIVGTLEPTVQFDACFRPASENVRHRWERIALARRTGIGLPPIVVQEQPGGYFVIDGRHRVSVARAFGDSDIEARVMGARIRSGDSSERSSRDDLARTARPCPQPRALNSPDPVC